MNQLKKCKTDEERWLHLINNSSSGYTVMLDNDDTYIVKDGSEDCVSFDDWVGNDDGLQSLFKAIGINSEGV